MKKLPLHERLRELTSEEITDLSLEMKCCWFYAPWNISMDATTVEGWAEQIGFYWINERTDVTHEDAIYEAIKVVNDLVEFTKKICGDEKFEPRKPKVYKVLHKLTV
jgi:uncharacterized membrane protein